jgi:hypothetical protein
MDIYAPTATPGQACRGPNQCTISHAGHPRSEVDNICTVKEVSDGVFTILSSVDDPTTDTPPTKFWEVLQRWQQTWMWENIKWVGEDNWIAEAITCKTCTAVTDGSFMKDFLIHSAAQVLECTRGRGRLWCSFLEASNNACS